MGPSPIGALWKFLDCLSRGEPFLLPWKKSFSERKKSNELDFDKSVSGLPQFSLIKICQGRKQMLLCQVQASFLCPNVYFKNSFVALTAWRALQTVVGFFSPLKNNWKRRLSRMEYFLTDHSRLAKSQKKKGKKALKGNVFWKFSMFTILAHFGRKLERGKTLFTATLNPAFFPLGIPDTTSGIFFFFSFSSIAGITLWSKVYFCFTVAKTGNALSGKSNGLRRSEGGTRGENRTRHVIKFRFTLVFVEKCKTVTS